MRTELYASLLLLISLCSGCQATHEPYQPLSLRAVDTSAELFTPSDIIGVRPTISSSPQAFEIWLQLSPAAGDRWTKLPEGTQLLCSSPRGTIGRTAVEHTTGIGKNGYFFRMPYNTQQEFDEAVRKLH